MQAGSQAFHQGGVSPEGKPAMGNVGAAHVDLVPRDAVLGLQPGVGQPDGVEHPRGGLHDAGDVVPRPGFRRDGLGVHGSQGIHIQEGLVFRAVPEGSAGDPDGVGQGEIPDAHGKVEAPEAHVLPQSIDLPSKTGPSTQARA